MYFFRWRKGGGALMHVYVLKHIGSLSYRTAWWIFTKLDRDEVLNVLHLCLGFLENSTQGRVQGGAKIGQWGLPSQKDFFFRFEGYSNKPNTWEWSKSIWEEAFLFLVPFWSQRSIYGLYIKSAPFFGDLNFVPETKNNNRFYVLKLLFLFYDNRFSWPVTSLLNISLQSWCILFKIRKIDVFWPNLCFLLLS